MASVPKPDSLKVLEAGLKSLYANMRTKMLRADDIVRRRYSGIQNLPDGVPVHQASTARSLAETLTDQIRTDEPSVVFSEYSNTQVAQKHKALMELAGRKLVTEIAARDVANPIEQSKFDLVVRAAACVKHVIDWDKVPDPPDESAYTSKKKYREALAAWKAERALSWPFEVRAVDPLSVYVSPGSRRPPRYVLEVQKRRAIDVLVDYPHWADPKRERRDGKNLLREVEWLEYWSDEHYIVEADGDRIIDKPNPYGRVPYEWAYNGRGRRNYDSDPAYLAENLLEAIMGELEAEVRMKTTLEAQATFHVFPRLITTMSPKIARRAFMTGPGAIIHVDDMQQKPEWLDTPPVTEGTLRFLEEIKASISKRFPPALTDRPEGVEAAVHQALLQSQAVKPLRPVKAALDQLYTDVLVGMMHQLRVSDLDISVYGRVSKVEREYTVKASDIDKLNFEVTFEATDPVDDDRRLLVGLQLLKVPNFASRRTVRQNYAHHVMPDSEAEEEQIQTELLVDQFMQMGMALQVVMQRLGAIRAEEAQQAGIGEARKQVSAAAEASVPGARERALGAVTGERVEAREEAESAFEESGIQRRR